MDSSAMNTPPTLERVHKFTRQREVLPNVAQDVSIFIIDDEPVVIETIRHYLHEAGFQGLHGFTSSTEAIEMLRFVCPDLILTDISMPDVSGNFLTKLIRSFEHLKDVPLLVVTADATQETEINILRLGADRVIRKPIDPEILVDEVTSAIRKNRIVTARKMEQANRDKLKSLEQVRAQEQQLRQQMGRSSEQ